MATSLFGPSTADIRRQDEQDFLNRFEVARRNPTAFAGATAGNLFGKAIVEAFGVRDPRVVRAQAREAALEQARAAGVDITTPQGLGQLSEIFQSNNLLEEALVARQTGVEMVQALAEAEKAEAASVKTRAETAKIVRDLNDDGTSLRSRVENARKAEPDAMALAEQRIRPEDFDNRDDFQRALLQEFGTQFRVLREQAKDTINPVTGEMTRLTPESLPETRSRIVRPGQSPQESRGGPQRAGAVPEGGSDVSGSSRGSESLTPDAPPPVVTQRSEIFRPPKGVIRAGTPQEFQQVKSSLDNFVGTFNRYLEQFDKRGVVITARPLKNLGRAFGAGEISTSDAPPEAQGMMTLYSQMLTQWNRDIAELGALAGADLGLLQDVIPPPVEAGGFGVSTSGDFRTELIQGRLEAYENAQFVLRQLAQGFATQFGRPIKIPRLRDPTIRGGRRP